MPIYIYAENTNGTYKKASLEAVSYAKSIATQNNESLVAIAINASDASEVLYNYGADQVIKIQDENLKNFNPKNYSEVISSEINGNIIIFPQSNNSASIAAMLAVKKSFSLITNVVALPESLSPFKVKRKCFSGKAFMMAQAETDAVVVIISQNSFGLKENKANGSEEIKNTSSANNNIQVVSQEKNSGKLDLKEADIVVSAGRGMKGPENWGMIEELAQVLGAATACSKPVSDIGWRPHSEHVGQTGKAISPKLYIAVGISGAIQHLAGVNASKTIVVINNDPEAAFFKSADYGVVGDAFHVVPQLVEKLKAIK